MGKWVSDLVRLSPLLKCLDKFVIDTLLNIDPGASTAALAVVEKDTKVNPRDSIINISIIKDNIGALTTQLKRDLLQIRASSGLHDLSANNGAASESNFVDVHVGGECSTGNLAEAGEDVDDTWGKAGLLDELGGIEGTKGGLFGGLEDDGVSAGHGWANFP